MNYFSPFVLPFVLGTFVLLGICVFKYIRWYMSFDRVQRSKVKKNILSLKFLPAIWEAILECLFHRKVFRRNLVLGYMHSSIAFGWFLLILVGAIEAEVCIHGSKPFWVAIFYRFFVHEHPTTTSVVFANIMDALLLVVLSGVMLAVIKMVYSKIVGMRRVTKHVLFDRFAKFSLWFIFPLRLLAESYTAAYYGNGGFMTQALGNLFAPIYHEYVEMALWTMYSICLAVFFVSMPFSRYMHIFTEVFLIFFRRMGVTEGDEPTGFTKYELSACSRCGICIDNCPMDKQLGVQGVQSVYLLRDVRYKRGTEEVANQCLMCQRCSSDCPVGLDLMTIRRQVRTKESALDASGNYSYADNIQAFNSVGRVLYFGGCMSHLTPGITESMIKIFEAVDQNYWYMDKNRTICCGRPLLQQGFLKQAKDLRLKNQSMIIKSKAKLLVTSCPICYQSFTKEYNLPIKVMHHTEYIAGLIKSGRLKLRKDDLKVVYHDPCELGRGCGIYDEPREVLKSVSNLVKAKDEKEKSLCCGFNLGSTVLTMEQQTKVRDAAVESLMYKNPDLIATACPMCKKAFNHATTLQVKDIAEIVAENIIDNGQLTMNN